MQVWLLRHASASWSIGARDPERPLTEEGERDAARMGTWMAAQGLRPDWTVTSPAERALRTARLVLPDGEVAVDERVYEAGLHDLLAVLTDAPRDAGRVLLVGHNPSLASLVRILDPAIPPPVNGELVRPCTLVRLELDDGPGHGGGRVLGIHHVRDLLD